MGFAAEEMIWVSERFSLTCFPRKLKTFPSVSPKNDRIRILPILVFNKFVNTWLSEWTNQERVLKLIEILKKIPFLLIPIVLSEKITKLEFLWCNLEKFHRKHKIQWSSFFKQWWSGNPLEIVDWSHSRNILQKTDAASFLNPCNWTNKMKWF